jgi:hypothetical protein
MTTFCHYGSWIYFYMQKGFSTTKLFKVIHHITCQVNAATNRILFNIRWQIWQNLACMPWLHKDWKKRVSLSVSYSVREMAIPIWYHTKLTWCRKCPGTLRYAGHASIVPGQWKPGYGRCWCLRNVTKTRDFRRARRARDDGSGMTNTWQS